MRMNVYLSSLTRLELDELKEQINLSDDEEMVFNELSKGRSNEIVASNCLISISTVDARIKSIRAKINRIGGCKI